MLRGANLGGSSKVPRVPDGATQLLDGFFNHRHVSFVGRPFPLAEADEHFARLREWGLTFLRFLVTWEAVEHAGPGLYDEEYLDYLRAVIGRAHQHGISLFVDPHQDMWSRWSGGDGAPGWTLEAAGFDICRLDETGAAITHQVRGDPFPRMIWPTNSGKLAAATMFTLFFGGTDFAPRSMVNGEPVQDYLQRHYIGAMRAVAERLKDLPNVAGYDTMNEPLPGYIGWEDLDTPGGIISLGEMPTAFQGMALGAGFPQEEESGGWDLRASAVRGRGSSIRTAFAGAAPPRLPVETERRVGPRHARKPRSSAAGSLCPWPRERSISRTDYYRPFARSFARHAGSRSARFHLRRSGGQPNAADMDGR